eukprot:scaffold245896_cov24-Tisochrysis_lutea.AAC.1
MPGQGGRPPCIYLLLFSLLEHKQCCASELGLTGLLAEIAQGWPVWDLTPKVVALVAVIAQQQSCGIQPCNAASSFRMIKAMRWSVLKQFSAQQKWRFFQYDVQHCIEQVGQHALFISMARNSKASSVDEDISAVPQASAC